MDDQTDIHASEEQPILPSEDPEQNLEIYPRWEYPERRDPKWGEVTKKGLIVGRGARQKVVPPDDVYRLATMGCTDRDIAEWFDISESTLRYNFSSFLQRARSQLKQRLRQAQLKAAFDGNSALLIWLGKQYLDQREQPINTDDNRILPWSD